MTTTLICTQCSEPKCVTSRGVVLPFVCDECEKAPELLAMAPASQTGACDSATVENTTLLIEDQANQLALAKNEVESLRAIVSFLDAREIALMNQNDRLTHERDMWRKRALLAGENARDESSLYRLARAALRLRSRGFIGR